MASSPDPPRILTACPDCGKQFRTPAANVGKRVQCPGCGQPFVIAPAGASAPAATAPPAAAKYCGICQCLIAAAEQSVVCPDCKHLFHQDCWQYNRGCGVYGCPKAPPTESLTSLEIPPSFWGREEKNCPRCGQIILAAATRCRHCGAMFSSATPQHAGHYQVEQAIRARLPAARTASIWLLVFSLLPCTAPLAAIAGLFWYQANRAVIRALPPLFAALGQIAIGVAIVQTVLMILIVLLRALTA